jgi:hypothetical protein
MTSEQIAAIVSVGDAIRANPRPWSQLTSQETAVLTAALLPPPPFDEMQRAYFARWWLACTQEQLAALNAACPPCTVITGRAKDAALYVCSDILSDALQDGPLAALLPILETLTLTYILPEEWPAPPEDGL